MEHEISPTGGAGSFRAAAEQRTNEKRKISRAGLPDDLYEIMENIFDHFEYAPNKQRSFTRHILETDEEQAFADAIPLYAFFGIQAATAKGREEFLEDKLKAIKPSDTGKKLSATELKMDVKNSNEYKSLITKLLHFRTIRRNCEIMAKAMEKRFEMARTKFVDARPTNRPDSWHHRSQQ